MSLFPVLERTSRVALIAGGFCTLANPTRAHEAWLLTPAEINALAAEPIPYIFTSYLVLGAAALIGCTATAAGLLAEEKLQSYEAIIAPKLECLAQTIGPTFLRWTLSLMLVLAGTGGLPRHGTALWVEPTLLVPDMQLSLVPDWTWLAQIQIALALFLALGFFTRVIGLAVIVLVAVGLGVFDAQFIAYAPHFVAPALILVLTGAGAWSLDQWFDPDGRLAPPVVTHQPIWRSAQILVGAGFVYLAVVYKLTQPTLLIAILQHGNLPTFGLPYPVIALIMTGVEIICGALLVVGRLVRPVSVVIIGAITFLAVTLGETPLFHANLYGSMLIFAMAGLRWPAQTTSPSNSQEAVA
ncbi:MAG: hypothetical protein ABJI96_08720 [Paracoccaceae bacterium]